MGHGLVKICLARNSVSDFCIDLYPLLHPQAVGSSIVCNELGRE